MELKKNSYTNFWKLRQENPGVPIILWGAGRYYYGYAAYIKFRYGADYIHDKKWEDDDINSFDGYRVLKFKDMKDIGKCLVIMCIKNSGGRERLSKRWSICQRHGFTS